MSPHEPKALRARLEELLGPRLDVHEVTFRPMFGGITGYTRGRNFASLSNMGLALKLSPADIQELLGVEGARPLRYEPDDPPSKSAVLLPDRLLGDDAFMGAWIDRSMQYCQTLPLPKKRKKAP